MPEMSGVPDDEFHKLETCRIMNKTEVMIY
jgi:hypothetical protein